MDKFLLLMSVAMGLCISGLGVFLIYEATTMDLGTSQVDCFDEHNNQINGLECTQEVTSDDLWFMTSLGVFLIMFGIVIGFGMSIATRDI